MDEGLVSEWVIGWQMRGLRDEDVVSGDWLADAWGDGSMDAGVISG